MVKDLSSPFASASLRASDIVFAIFAASVCSAVRYVFNIWEKLEIVPSDEISPSLVELPSSDDNPERDEESAPVSEDA